MEAARVDDARFDLADRERDGGGGDPFVRGLPLETRQDLRVVDPLQVEPLGKDHGGRDEWAGERAAARFVDACDPREPLFAEHPLVPAEIVRQCSHAAREGGQMITNACPITRSIGM